MAQESLPKLAIFDTFKTKGNELTGEATRQRSIVATLATRTNPAERTRTAISQTIAKYHGIVWKNIYSGIFRDLDEILIPLGIVEEEGRLPLKRGPKALQEKGIPYYNLTKKGLLVALGIKEISNKKKILERFFVNADNKEKQIEKVITKLEEMSSSFTFSIFEKYVKAFCEGTIVDLLPFDLSKLKITSDDSIKTCKEFVDGFFKLSKQEREDIVNFLNKIT